MQPPAAAVKITRGVSGALPISKIGRRRAIIDKTRAANENPYGS
jgi:hypothetical protein